MRSWQLVVAALLVTPAVARGENQIWNAAVIQARNAPTGVTGWFDLHARRRSTSTVVIARPGIGWTFSPALAVHVGYAYIPTLVDAARDTREHRVWQQVIFNHAAGAAAKLQARARLEQRFGSGDDVGHRVRVFARAQWQPSPSVNLQLVGWDELFLGLNDTDWAAKSGYDQNRLFVGLGTDTKLAGVRVEAGYLSVHLSGDAPLVHAVAVNLFATIAP
jgi:hypothetical protein